MSDGIGPDAEGSARRVLGIAVLGVVAAVASCIAFVPLREHRGIAPAVLCASAAAAGATASGGLLPGLLTVAAGGLSINYLYFPPVHTFRLAEGGWITLLVYVNLNAFLCLGVEGFRRSLRRRQERETDTLALARTAEALVTAPSLDAALAAVLREAVDATRAAGGAIDVRDDDGWRRTAELGVTQGPTTSLPLGDPGTEAGRLLVSRPTGARSSALLQAFATQGSLAIERDRLRAVELRAGLLAEEERVRRQFFSALSHDLRTPITAIEVAASALASDELELDAAGRKELARTVVEEADRLERMVGSLLDLARLDAHALRPRVTVIEPRDLLAQAADRARRAGVLVYVDAARAQPICADLDLVARMVDNLVMNAARFAPDSSIELVARGTEICVVDHGPGVPPRDRDRVFERFYRGRRDVGEGTGLGLAICLGIMQAHGGTIRHEPTPGGGATFVCTFPVEARLPA